jgi:hypothetical protein
MFGEIQEDLLHKGIIALRERERASRMNLSIALAPFLHFKEY